METQVCGHNMSQTASWTCFILLPKQKSIPLALAIAWDFPAQCIQKPQRRKSHAHHEELVNVISKNSNILSSGLQGLQHKNKHDQWNSATDSCCFFHRQVCKFLFEDAADEMKWVGTLWFLAPPALRSWIQNGLANPSMKNQILNFKESENEFWNGHKWMLGRVLERLLADALASMFYAHLELPQPKGFEAFLPKSCSCAAFCQAWPWACHWRGAGGLCGDWNLWTLAA